MQVIDHFMCVKNADEFQRIQRRIASALGQSVNADSGRRPRQKPTATDAIGVRYN